MYEPIEMHRKLNDFVLNCAMCGVTVYVSSKDDSGPGVPMTLTCPNCRTKNYMSRVNEVVTIVYGNVQLRRDTPT